MTKKSVSSIINAMAMASIPYVNAYADLPSMMDVPDRKKHRSKLPLTKFQTKARAKAKAARKARRKNRK